MFGLAQLTVDVLSVFIYPFIITLVISWAVSLFRYK